MSYRIPSKSNPVQQHRKAISKWDQRSTKVTQKSVRKAIKKARNSSESPRTIRANNTSSAASAALKTMIIVGVFSSLIAPVGAMKDGVRNHNVKAETSFPYVGSHESVLYNKAGCSGTRLTAKHVITNKHCFEKGRTTAWVYNRGAWVGNYIWVKNIYNHPKEDLSIIELETPAQGKIPCIPMMSAETLRNLKRSQADINGANTGRLIINGVGGGSEDVGRLFAGYYDDAKDREFVGVKRSDGVVSCTRGGDSGSGILGVNPVTGNWEYRGTNWGGNTNQHLGGDCSVNTGVFVDTTNPEIQKWISEQMAKGGDTFCTPTEDNKLIISDLMPRGSASNFDPCKAPRDTYDGIKDLDICKCYDQRVAPAPAKYNCSPSPTKPSAQDLEHTKGSAKCLNVYINKIDTFTDYHVESSCQETLKSVMFYADNGKIVSQNNVKPNAKLRGFFPGTRINKETGLIVTHANGFRKVYPDFFEYTKFATPKTPPPQPAPVVTVKPPTDPSQFTNADPKGEAACINLRMNKIAGGKSFYQLWHDCDQNVSTALFTTTDTLFLNDIPSSTFKSGEINGHPMTDEYGLMAKKGNGEYKMEQFFFNGRMVFPTDNSQYSPPTATTIAKVTSREHMGLAECLYLEPIVYRDNESEMTVGNWCAGHNKVAFKFLSGEGIEWRFRDFPYGENIKMIGPSTINKSAGLWFSIYNDRNHMQHFPNYFDSPPQPDPRGAAACLNVLQKKTSDLATKSVVTKATFENTCNKDVEIFFRETGQADKVSSVTIKKGKSATAKLTGSIDLNYGANVVFNDNETHSISSFFQNMKTLADPTTAPTPKPTTKPKSTTGPTTPVVTESTTETTTPVVTESTTETTTPVVTESTTETTTPVVTESTTETTTPVVTESTTGPTTPVVTASTTETTTPVVAESTTETTTPVVAESTTETTTPVVAESTTETTTPVTPNSNARSVTPSSNAGMNLGIAVAAVAAVSVASIALACKKKRAHQGINFSPVNQNIELMNIEHPTAEEQILIGDGV